jgi:hypothetical protein
MTPVFMSDWKLFVIVAAIGVGVFYLRNYVRKKAENLAQKEDLKDLTDVVERVRAQFERANLVHRVQFETEFRVCRDVWRVAHDTHREFIRLFPIAVGPPEEGQREKFVDAQLAFTNALEGCKPFVSAEVWRAFYSFDDLMIPWKDAEIPMVERNEYRKEARLSLERCAAEIRKRFSELLVV